MRLAIAVGSGVGLVVSIGVLVLMWFGVAGVLAVGNTNLMYVFWPSAVLLVRGWRSAPIGILITVYAVLANCLTYAGVALLVRGAARLIFKRVGTSRPR